MDRVSEQSAASLSMLKDSQSYTNYPMHRIERIHFVGIGGSGMNGIAEVLINQGYQVSGSDIQENQTTRHLQELGATVYKDHRKEQVVNVDVVVVSSAIDEENPEIIRARELRIPIIKRAVMLAELMRFRQGIAVAGTHGKTTTTSLVASLLAEAGLDPTFIIGGLLNSAGRNAYLGKGPFLVAEADESDASFMYLHPTISIVTNIEAEHLINYQNNFSVLKETFVEFIHLLPFYGLAILCIDDPVVRELLPRIDRPIITYGMEKDADIYATDIKHEGLSTLCKVVRRGKKDALTLKLNLVGRHNILNTLAAIAVATELGVDDETIMMALAKFSGVGRRFEIIGEYELPSGKVTVVDDYGHHPTEVAAVIATARQVWPGQRIVMTYQPHRYSRTKELFDEFVDVLSQVDELYLLDVYSAGEDVIPHINSAALAQAIDNNNRARVTYLQDKNQNELCNILAAELKDGDMLFMQGAGSISALTKQVADRFCKIRTQLRQESEHV